MARSYLQLAPEALDSAAHTPADAIIIDLAGTPPDTLRTARKTVAAWLPEAPTRAEVWVRINPGPQGHDDAREVVGPGLRGFCVAKAESAVQLDSLDAVLSTVEHDAGLAPRSLLVAPVLASAAAVLAALAIARAPRVAWLQLDEAELRAQLGLALSPDERELLLARSQIVLASAAAGIGRPVGSATLDVDDLPASTLMLKRLGFAGRACADVGQIAVVLEAFEET